MSDFDRMPVPQHALQPGRHFAASYAGEHVAGTEFVIGAMFVSWGVGTAEVLWGLLIGNSLAVLSWVLICAPVATGTRLTLYAYLEKIAGPSFLKIYSVINGVLFCVLAGAMITVSASAVRVLFGIEPQTQWYPTSPTFVLVALGVGLVVTIAAVRGFAFVARFAEVSAPWMIVMFFVGAVATFPVLKAQAGTPTVGNPAELLALAENVIWQDSGGPMGVWHVVAVAWGANLAFHGGFGDMTILRFARRTSYAWYSALGMFIGHFGAWLAAGMMGAAAAALLGTTITALDAGEVAYQALGAVGILAVIIAGWTTSNPTIYRAGLAFQSLVPRWSRERVTLLTGLVTTVIAVFPFVFTQLLSFLGIMALVLAPTGGIIFAEYHLLNRLGLRRHWREAAGLRLNLPAVLTWALALATTLVLARSFSIHILFQFVPAWLLALLLYPVLVSFSSTARSMRGYDEVVHEEEAAARPATARPSRLGGALQVTALVSLALCLAISLHAFSSGDLAAYKADLVWPTLTYFSAALAVIFVSRRRNAQE